MRYVDAPSGRVVRSLAVMVVCHVSAWLSLAVLLVSRGHVEARAWVAGD